MQKDITITKEQIDDIICEIMIKDGPDRHVDGHDVITDFIVALTEGKAEEWAARYEKGEIKAADLWEW